MSWGTELWDQLENIEKHTQKGIDASERISHFYKERCNIEVEYARMLKKLVKNFQPKKKEEEEYAFTSANGFQDSLKEIHDLAGQHEMIAENIQSLVLKDLQSLLTELKIERRKHLQECMRLIVQLKGSLDALDKSKRKYERAYSDSEKAQDAYKRADADINLSRADVEKHKNVSVIKQQICEDCKNEYASQLQQTNQTQREHYTDLMPQAFNLLQQMDERRTTKVGEHIRQTADIERNVLPIINTCIEGIETAGNLVHANQDSQLVIEKYKSGFPPPDDIPFEDLSSGGSMTDLQQNHTPKVQYNSTVQRGTLSQKGKKRTGLFAIFGSSKADEQKEDFSDLPPNQRRKKLQHKLELINKEITKEKAEREGMLKMKQVYKDNPALGDPASLDKKIEENAQKLDSLQQDLKKYEDYLADADGRSKRHSLSDDAMSQSASDSSVHRVSNAFSSAPGTPIQQHHYDHIQAGQENHRQSVDQTTRNSAVQSDSHHSDINFADQDSFDEVEDDHFPVIGNAKAIYPFEPTNDVSVALMEYEEMSVLETDQGDGWTRVRKHEGMEGFVPTSYIEIHLFDDHQV